MRHSVIVLLKSSLKEVSTKSIIEKRRHPLLQAFRSAGCRKRQERVDCVISIQHVEHSLVLFTCGTTVFSLSWYQILMAKCSFVEELIVLVTC